MVLHPYNWQPDGPDALVHAEIGLAISRHVLTEVGLPADIRVGRSLTKPNGDNSLKRSFRQPYVHADSIGLDLDRLPYIPGGYRIDEGAAKLLRHVSERRAETIQRLCLQWSRAWTIPQRWDWYHFVETRATVTKEGVTAWWVLKLPAYYGGTAGALRHLWVGFFTCTSV